METVLFLMGAAVVAAVGVWAPARLGRLRGTLVAVAVAAAIIAVLVATSDDGPATWALLVAVPVVFVVQTVTQRSTRKATP